MLLHSVIGLLGGVLSIQTFQLFRTLCYSNTLVIFRARCILWGSHPTAESWLMILCSGSVRLVMPPLCAGNISMGTLCRQGNAMNHPSSTPDFSLFVSPNVYFAQRYTNTEYTAGAPDICHGPWNCPATGWGLDTLYISMPETSCFNNTGKMKDSIFLPCFLPVLCLKHSLGKRKIQESALFHVGTMSHSFPHEGEFTPILYENGKDSTLQPLLKDWGSCQPLP